MRLNDILEIADSVKRTSHRVRNSGDVELAKLGLQFAKRVEKQETISKAKEIETEYLWVLKEKYFPILPNDKVIPTIVSMAGYDDGGSSGEDSNSTFDGSVDIGNSSNHDGMNDSVLNVPQGTDVTVIDGSSEIELPNSNVDVEPSDVTQENNNDNFVVVFEQMSNEITEQINNPTSVSIDNNSHVYGQIDFPDSAIIANGATILAEQYNTNQISYSQDHQAGHSDCSQFVYHAIKEQGFDVPYVTARADTEISIKDSPYFEKVSTEDARPGDVIVGHGGVSPHMGIYQGITNGKMMGTQMGLHGAHTVSWGTPTSGIPAKNIEFYRPIKPID